MAVTLGPGPDLLVRRASVGRMSRAVIYQAAAAAMEKAQKMAGTGSRE